MIKTLRKRHLQAWTALSVLLPVGIISAWMVIPGPVKDRLLQPASTMALPVLFRTVDKGSYSASLRGSRDSSSLQLEWINRSALTSPSAIIYRSASATGGAEGAEIIGRIGARGTYRWPLKKDSVGNGLHFLVYDIIHHQLIDRINF
ncbi:MAG TPA: hypothetical protein VE035_09445 [Puia sp.]|nr:hypothetical protein [Puia sp.]